MTTNSGSVSASRDDDRFFPSEEPALAARPGGLFLSLLRPSAGGLRGSMPAAKWNVLRLHKTIARPRGYAPAGKKGRRGAGAKACEPLCRAARHQGESQRDGRGCRRRRLHRSLAQRPRRVRTVLVRLAPHVEMAELSAFLEREHARIVDGPRAGGFFKLSFPDAARADRDEIVARLADQGALFSLVLPGDRPAARSRSSKKARSTGDRAICRLPGGNRHEWECLQGKSTIRKCGGRRPPARHARARGAPESMSDRM